jgi:hypothetical protein
METPVMDEPKKSPKPLKKKEAPGQTNATKTSLTLSFSKAPCSIGKLHWQELSTLALQS